MYVCMYVCITNISMKPEPEQYVCLYDVCCLCVYICMYVYVCMANISTKSEPEQKKKGMFACVYVHEYVCMYVLRIFQ